jgi:hypothetical protein
MMEKAKKFFEDANKYQRERLKLRKIHETLRREKMIADWEKKAQVSTSNHKSQDMTASLPYENNQSRSLAHLMSNKNSRH